MKELLFALLLIQASPAPKGFATGIVRSANGGPASGVRVFAVPAGDPNAAATGGLVFESLAQTDAAGRYRLEIPAGRYYIAVGSVTSPTYYPDTASMASARVLSIAAGSTVENVDFSRYTAATSSPNGVFAFSQPPLPPGSTGVIAGVVRAADGSVAAGVPVSIVPVSVLNNPQAVPALFQIAAIYILQGGVSQAIVRGGVNIVTDGAGRYRVENVTPDTYKILAGYSDAPAFYPGETDIQKAAVITTTPTTLLTNIDITLPPQPISFSIQGLVSARDGQPLGGATLSIQRVGTGANSAAASYLPNRTYRPVVTGGDGAFEASNISPGKYEIQMRVSGTSAVSRIVDVVDKNVTTDFVSLVNVLSGRIVDDDGSPDVSKVIREVAVSTTSNPNFVSTDVMSVSSSGAFSSAMISGDYRFFIRSLQDGFVVRSMNSGTVDLSSNPLHMTSDTSNLVEIHVAKGAGPGTRVRGRVLDAVTGAVPSADRIELCCFATGPFERMSTAVLPDGSFDFTAVPPGRYSTELQPRAGQKAAEIANRMIEIADKESSGILLMSATQLAPVTATLKFDDGTNVPSSMGVAVSLTALLALNASSSSAGSGTPKEVSVPMARLLDETYWTPFPASVRYTLTVGNLPPGYSVESISGLGGISAVPTTAGDGARTYSGFAPAVVSIVLQRTTAR